jgi:hypothetical protein
MQHVFYCTFRLFFCSILFLIYLFTANFMKFNILLHFLGWVRITSLASYREIIQVHILHDIVCDPESITKHFYLSFRQKL